MKRWRPEWNQATSRAFEEVFATARANRLLRGDELRIEGDKPRRYIRLGHDALARVADAWHQERITHRFAVHEVARVIMTYDITCQLCNLHDQAEVIWSSRGGFFRPYVITGAALTELAAPSTPVPRSGKAVVREALGSLVISLYWARGSDAVGAVVRAGGSRLPAVQPSASETDETARKVRRWLKDLRKQSGLIGLEVVVEERANDPGVPLGAVEPRLRRAARQHQAAFQSGQSRALAAVLGGPLHPDQCAAC